MKDSVSRRLRLISVIAERRIGGWCMAKTVQPGWKSTKPGTAISLSSTMLDRV
jgi:hypothetical protein